MLLLGGQKQSSWSGGCGSGAVPRGRAGGHGGASFQADPEADPAASKAPTLPTFSGSSLPQLPFLTSQECARPEVSCPLILLPQLGGKALTSRRYGSGFRVWPSFLPSLSLSQVPAFFPLGLPAGGALEALRGLAELVTEGRGDGLAC